MPVHIRGHVRISFKYFDKVIIMQEPDPSSHFTDGHIRMVHEMLGFLDAKAMQIIDEIGPCFFLEQTAQIVLLQSNKLRK